MQVSYDPFDPQDVERARLLQAALGNDKPKADVVPIKPAAKPAAKPTPPPRPTAPAPAPAPAAATTGLEYEKHLKPIILQLSRNAVLRPKLIAIYKEFDVAVGSELKPEQFPDVLARLKTELEEAGIKPAVDV